MDNGQHQNKEKIRETLELHNFLIMHELMHLSAVTKVWQILYNPQEKVSNPLSTCLNPTRKSRSHRSMCTFVHDGLKPSRSDGLAQ